MRKIAIVSPTKDYFKQFINPNIDKEFLNTTDLKVYYDKTSDIEYHLLEAFTIIDGYFNIAIDGFIGILTGSIVDPYIIQASEKLKNLCTENNYKRVLSITIKEDTAWYVNGKLIKSGTPECPLRDYEFLELAEKYNFTSKDVDVFFLNDTSVDAINYLQTGVWPENIDAFINFKNV